MSRSWNPLATVFEANGSREVSESQTLEDEGEVETGRNDTRSLRGRVSFQDEHQTQTQPDEVTSGEQGTKASDTEGSRNISSLRRRKRQSEASVAYCEDQDDEEELAKDKSKKNHRTLRQRFDLRSGRVGIPMRQTVTPLDNRHRRIHRRKSFIMNRSQFYAFWNNESSFLQQVQRDENEQGFLAPDNPPSTTAAIPTGQQPSPRSRAQVFRIQNARSQRSTASRWFPCFCPGTNGDSTWYHEETTGWVGTRIMHDALRWTYRASYLLVALMAYLIFLAFTLFFAGLIFLIAQGNPGCIAANTQPDNDIRDGTRFIDCFQLSWTTFATVGFGAVAPKPTGCELTNCLMAFESFMGVLYGSITAAMLVAKMARCHAVAQVIHSSVACVRFTCPEIDEKLNGNEADEKFREEQVQPTEIMPMKSEGEEASDVAMGPDDAVDKTIVEKEDSMEFCLPCPVLEFRLVNELSHIRGGEIVDANVSVVARTKLSGMDFADDSEADSSDCSDEDDRTSYSDESFRSANSKHSAFFGASNGSDKSGSVVQQLSHMFGRVGHQEIPGSETAEVQPYASVREDIRRKEERKKMEAKYERRLLNKLKKMRQDVCGPTMKRLEQTTIKVDEVHAPPSGRSQPIHSPIHHPLVFHKITLETDKHPFFKRVWTVRHRLSESSPLLTAEARRTIRKNGGTWPRWLIDLALDEEDGGVIQFYELIVHFSGVANASGSAVYAQKLYTRQDIMVGHEFKSVLTVVDGRLIAQKNQIDAFQRQSRSIFGSPQLDNNNQGEIQNNEADEESIRIRRGFAGTLKNGVSFFSEALLNLVHQHHLSEEEDSEEPVRQDNHETKIDIECGVVSE